MTQPTGPAGMPAQPPPSSVFIPEPPPGPPPTMPPPPEDAPLPAEPPSAYKQQAHAVMSSHHGVQGRLEVLGRRLAELLAGHAALVSHITDQAPAASSSTPGGTAFWGQVLDQHQIIHGLLKAAETEAASLLSAHAGVIGAVESLL